MNYRKFDRPLTCQNVTWTKSSGTLQGGSWFRFQTNSVTECLCNFTHTDQNRSAQEALNKHQAFPKKLHERSTHIIQSCYYSYLGQTAKLDSCKTKPEACLPFQPLFLGIPEYITVYCWFSVHAQENIFPFSPTTELCLKLNCSSWKALGYYIASGRQTRENNVSKPKQWLAFISYHIRLLGQPFAKIPL